MSARIHACLVLACILAAGLASAESKESAEKAAVDDGRVRLRQSIDQTNLDANWTVGALLRRLRGEAAFAKALAAAEKPGAVRWLDEKSCQVIVSVPGAEVARALGAIATEAGDPQTDPRWVAQATADWPKRSFSAIGSNCPKPAAAPTRPHLPAQPPAWVVGLADAEATAKSGETRLKTARLAERQAAAVLREKVRALELSPRLTLGAAADKSAPITRAIEAALRSARVYKTEYQSDGSVRVRMSLNLRVLWAELEQAR